MNPYKHPEKGNHLLRIILYLQILLMVPNTSNACDVCGVYMGITPYDNQSSISAIYRYRNYYGYASTNSSPKLFGGSPHMLKLPDGSTNPILHERGISPNLVSPLHASTETKSTTYTATDFERFQTFELRGKYFLHQRWEINAIVPVVMNQQKINTTYTQTAGLGDLSLMSGFHLIRNIETNNLQQRLIVGMGVKLPTGNNHLTDEDNERIDFYLQPGTGSWDYFPYVHYLLGYKRYGLNILGSYKRNGTNHHHEQLANSITTNASLFAKLYWKSLTIIPNLQSYYERTQGIWIHQQLVSNTALHTLYAGAGLDVFYKNWGLNLLTQLAVKDYSGPENIQAAGRLTAGIIYSFNQSRYLIKSK